MGEKKDDIGQLSTLTLVRLHTFPAQDHAAVLREFGLACFSAGAESAEAELAALRAKWEVLRGECEAVRELGDWSANTHNPRSSEVESTMLRLLGEVIAARTLTDSTHALEEE